MSFFLFQFGLYYSKGVVRSNIQGPRVEFDLKRADMLFWINIYSIQNSDIMKQNGNIYNLQISLLKHKCWKIKFEAKVLLTW